LRASRQSDGKGAIAEERIKIIAKRKEEAIRQMRDVVSSVALPTEDTNNTGKFNTCQYKKKNSLAICKAIFISDFMIAVAIG